MSLRVWLTLIVLLTPLAAQTRFDQSYFALQFGYSYRSYPQSSGEGLFGNYKDSYKLSWGHYFTETSAYEIGFSSNRSEKSLLTLVSGSNLLDLTLDNDVTVNTQSELKQVTFCVKQLWPLDTTFLGELSLEGSLGFARGWAHHYIQHNNANVLLDGVHFSHRSLYPHFSIGLVLSPPKSALQFTMHYGYDITDKMGTKISSLSDAAQTDSLGNVTLGTHNSHSLRLGLQYLY